MLLVTGLYSFLGGGEGGRTEILLASGALLDDLDETWLQLLNGGNVVGEHTHITGFRGDVDLDDILGFINGLFGERMVSDLA